VDSGERESVCERERENEEIAARALMTDSTGLGLGQLAKIRQASRTLAWSPPAGDRASPRLLVLQTTQRQAN
jgi:hypothetical protein